MNLFVTSASQIKCTVALDDKRIGKLLMEANQMLSLAVKFPSNTLFEDLDNDHFGIGKVCHGSAYMNHPVSLWVRKTRGNFDWTSLYAHSLAAEYFYRFGKKHASSDRTLYIQKFADRVNPGQLTPFVNCAANFSLGLDFKHIEDTTEAYQRYLEERWKTDKREPVWTRRKRPVWKWT